MRRESIGVICVLAVLAWFIFYGVYASLWSAPKYRTKIVNLQIEKQAWQGRAITAEAQIEDYKVAMNYETLFLLMCKPDTITLIGDLEEQIKNKADFCLGDFNKEVE